MARLYHWERPTLLDRFDTEKPPTPPSPEQIAARRAELLQHAHERRAGFPAPIIVNGEVSHYAIIFGGRIVGRKYV